jgi:hypothetical protein
MDGSGVQSGKEYSSPEWGSEVVDALRKQLTWEARDAELRKVTLIRADLERDGDGIAFLRAVYDHSDQQRRIGVRRQLDYRGPLAHMQGMTLAESKAYDIAHYDMAEPLSSYWNLLIEDADRVWWWGDGYPGQTP